jgi:hypothetical protein
MLSACFNSIATCTSDPLYITFTSPCPYHQKRLQQRKHNLEYSHAVSLLDRSTPRFLAAGRDFSRNIAEATAQHPRTSPREPSLWAGHLWPRPAAKGVGSPLKNEVKFDDEEVVEGEREEEEMKEHGEGEPLDDDDDDDDDDDVLVDLERLERDIFNLQQESDEEGEGEGEGGAVKVGGSDPSPADSQMDSVAEDAKS